MHKSLATLTFLILLGCGSTTPTYERRARQEFAMANYQVAEQLARRAVEENPGDARLAELYRQFNLAATLDRARDLIHVDKELEGIAILRGVLEEDPANADARRWLKKGIKKKTAKLLLQAEMELTAGRMAEAKQLCLQILDLDPESQEARDGLARVEEQALRNLEKAERFYLQAVDARAELEWQQVLYYAEIARSYDPDREDARELKLMASKRIARLLVRVAEDTRAAKLWGAASRAFSLAADYEERNDPATAKELRGKADEMDQEQEADALLDQARMRLISGRFDDAVALLEQADPLCHHDRVRFTELRFEIRNARAKAAFEQARRLERDHRFDEALEIYRGLVDGLGGDEATKRIRSIEETLKRVEELYGQAAKLEAEGKLDEAEGLWREIRALHRRYKDVDEKLRARGS
ncbi:MAG: hypothetical protein R3F30_02140 [Planctomycetota bacterium]